jgi:hypothetical protein
MYIQRIQFSKQTKISTQVCPELSNTGRYSTSLISNVNKDIKQ